jgi:shikimate dehydrogenase
MAKKTFGLLGYPLSHSFSQIYFTEKFKQLGLGGYSYKLFPLDNIRQFPELIMRSSSLVGLNVTIPYKEDILNYLDLTHPVAAAVGAVNCVLIRQTKGDLLIQGYNTDVYGFEKTLHTFIPAGSHKALILGTGGSSKAVAYVLGQQNIPYTIVSRNPAEGQLAYHQLDQACMSSHSLIINCTPVGMFPHIDDAPAIPYQFISSHHYCYDLIYNPAETMFLTKCLAAGAKIKNGLDMLYLQADRSFDLWESNGKF